MVDGSRQYLWNYVLSFSAYILADTIWVVVKPRCVASPTTIVVHHVVVQVGLITLLYMEPSLARLCGCGGMIEVNTFFLIARRNFRDSKIISFFFWLSWIPVRCIMGPFLSGSILFALRKQMPLEEYVSATIMLLITLALNILNFKWTYDLFKKQNTGKLDKGL